MDMVTHICMIVKKDRGKRISFYMLYEIRELREQECTHTCTQMRQANEDSY